MYSIDGVALHNPGMGWKFRGPSRPLSDLTVQRTSLRAPGLPGVLAGIDDPLASLDAPVPTLVVQTPRHAYDHLLALLAGGQTLSLTGQPDWQAPYELVSTSHQGFGPADAIIDVTATLRIPGVFWRATEENTITTDLTGSNMTVDLWPMTGLVTDAVIRARAVTGLEIASRNAHIVYPPAIAAGSYLRYHCDSGRAFLTTTDTWVGGSEVSGQVDDDGPGEKFAIYPTRIAPGSSVARLTIKTTARASGARLEVRGKAARLV